MKTETTSITPLIYESILHIMNEVEAIGKNKKNQQQGFMYRGIDDLYNDLQPKFAKHGVFITSEVLEEKREERQSKAGGLLLWTILKVRFNFFAKDGSHVSSIMVGEAMDNGDKGSNKAMSIALKYCLMQLLLIPTEDVKKSDPDSEIHQPVAKKIEVKSEPVKRVLKAGTEEFDKAIKFLIKDNGTIERLRKSFDISKEDEELLLFKSSGASEVDTY